MKAKTSRLVRASASCGLALALCGIHAKSTAGEMQAAAPAPPFSLDGSAGMVALKDFRGQLVYLDFWASWCGPCRQSFPFMNAMQRKYAARGLRVVAINLDQARTDAERFLRAVPAEFTIAFDPAGDAPKQYGIKGMPSSVLIGRDGKVIATHAGFKKRDEATLERAIVEALDRGA